MSKHLAPDIKVHYRLFNGVEHKFYGPVYNAVVVRSVQTWNEKWWVVKDDENREHCLHRKEIIRIVS